MSNKRVELFKKFISDLGDIDCAIVIARGKDGGVQVMETPDIHLVDQIGLASFLHEFMKNSLPMKPSWVEELRKDEPGDVN